MLPHTGQELRRTIPIDRKEIVLDDKRKPLEIFNIMISPSCVG